MIRFDRPSGPTICDFDLPEFPSTTTSDGCWIDQLLNLIDNHDSFMTDGGSTADEGG
jgi:hypothetical protein